MRKICLLTVSFLLFLTTFNFFPIKVWAENAPVSSESAQVNYELPYPGLLPDNPLYSLKVIRDKIVGFLISDPLKKAEFNHLQADKRFNAGIYLINKNKISLGLSTISKAENYFAEALSNVGDAKKQKENTSATEGRMKDALKKYEQELTILTEKVDANYRASFENELKRVIDFQKGLK